jgi:hypothetical protein
MPLSVMFASAKQPFSLDLTPEKNSAENVSQNQSKKKLEQQ